MWKILISFMLKGYNPVWIALGIVILLSFIVLSLIYGFDRRCLAALSGASLGILVTCILGVLFTNLFQIHGAVMEASESLLYAGYQNLNLTQIFMAQGTPISFILNYKYVAAEIIHTIVGSFGLVTVAPLTAITSGILLTRKKKKEALKS